MTPCTLPPVVLSNEACFPAVELELGNPPKMVEDPKELLAFGNVPRYWLWWVGVESFN